MERKKVVIYGTLGPACRDRDTLRAMFRAGMDGIRLNLSHTTLEAAAGLIETYHAAARDCGAEPELLIDMQGPELRVGDLPAPLTLDTGAVISPERLPFPAPVVRALAASGCGQEVLLDDGKLLLRALASGDLEVVRGGVLTGRKSVALPGQTIVSPAMTEKDRVQLAQAGSYGVTAVMQPFVRCREDLMQVRSALEQAGSGHIRLFAKIENQVGIRRLPELLPCCDEIVIARGDLGNAMDLWQLPAAQKRIAAQCRAAGRDFMVVTQMLDSMTHRSVPTRAEVSDIFNAVLDGAASVMVTGETAAGDYPVEVIRYLVNTVRAAEDYCRSGKEV